MVYCFFWQVMFKTKQQLLLLESCTYQCDLTCRWFGKDFVGYLLDYQTTSKSLKGHIILLMMWEIIWNRRQRASCLSTINPVNSFERNILCWFYFHFCLLLDDRQFLCITVNFFKRVLSSTHLHLVIYILHLSKCKWMHFIQKLFFQRETLKSNRCFILTLLCVLKTLNSKALIYGYKRYVR